VASDLTSGGKEVLMVTRNVHNWWTLLAFCLLAAAAMYWSYLVKSQQGAGTVVIEQVQEPAWAVEIQPVTSDDGSQR
jgi:hypothetical protein